MCKPVFDKNMYDCAELMRDLGFSEKERRTYIKSCYSLFNSLFGIPDCLEKTLEKAKSQKLGKIETENLLEEAFDKLDKKLTDGFLNSKNQFFYDSTSFF